MALQTTQSIEAQRVASRLHRQIRLGPVWSQFHTWTLG